MSEKIEAHSPRHEDAARLPERRTFLKAAVATALAGGAIAGGIPSATAKTVARRLSCETQYDIDYAACKKKRTALRKALCYSEAMATYAACMASETVDEIVIFFDETAEDIATWMRNNPELVFIGSVVVVAGITYVIVVSGGTATPILVALA